MPTTDAVDSEKLVPPNRGHRPGNDQAEVGALSLHLRGVERELGVGAIIGIPADNVSRAESVIPLGL